MLSGPVALGSGLNQTQGVITLGGSETFPGACAGVTRKDVSPSLAFPSVGLCGVARALRWVLAPAVEAVLGARLAPAFDCETASPPDLGLRSRLPLLSLNIVEAPGFRRWRSGVLPSDGRPAVGGRRLVSGRRGSSSIPVSGAASLGRVPRDPTAATTMRRST